MKIGEFYKYNNQQNLWCSHTEKNGEYNGMRKFSVFPPAQPYGELAVDNAWVYTSGDSPKNK